MDQYEKLEKIGEGTYGKVSERLQRGRMEEACRFGAARREMGPG